MDHAILKILNQHRGEYVSGQKICEQLNVSRMSISNSIKKLKEKGYMIETSTRKGYCLTLENDIIDIDEIQKHLAPFYHHIQYFDNIDSTNTYMKTHHFKQGDIVIADSQSQGRGRNGRHFHSPKQKGIYLSFLLKPDLTIYDSLKITACCAVALVKSIKKNYPLDPKIKWVNDILIDHRKIAGILCEASLEMNTAQIEQMVVGVGINVHSYTMPQDIQDIAGCLEDHVDIFVPRQKIIIDFLNFFYDDYCHISDLSFLDDYRHYSCVLHQNIMVYDKVPYPAYVKAINDDASLCIIVDGQEKCLSSGEISIRPIPQHT